MQPRIAHCSPKRLVGVSLEMSLASNQTAALFRSFMPRRKEVKHALPGFVLDLIIYPEFYYRNFSPANRFTKWAFVEVEQIEDIPEGMQSFVLEAGEYAVFKQTGPPNDPAIFQYIFSRWLPKSAYEVDDRPHFDILPINGEEGGSDIIEEIWIPIKKKGQ